MKKIVPVLLVLGVLGVFVWTLFFLYGKSQAKPVETKTDKPEVRDIVKKTVASGAISPREEIEIKPRVSGIVEKLHVEPGEAVKAGDLIAKIQIVPDMVTLNRAETAVKTARISFQNAEREMDRYQKLYSDNMIAESEFQKYKLERELRREELASAEDNLALVKEGASRRTGKASNLVRSTVDGMVLAVPVKEGASVIESNTFNAGSTIATIADMSDMVFLGQVDESEVGRITEGMPLQIKIGAIPDRTFDGKLEYISPKGLSQEGAIQFEIRAALDRVEDVFVRAGYSATADIVLDRAEKVLAVPEGVVQFDEGKPFVEVATAEPGKFEKKPVELGLSDGLWVEVLSGVDKDAVMKRPQ